MIYYLDCWFYFFFLPFNFCSLLSSPQEEVMTLERILLQTIKFDLQVEHPYAFLLKFSKSIKGLSEL